MMVNEQALQERVREFVRRFGLLEQDQTPCGRPMPTSHAHALDILGRMGVATQRDLAAQLRLDESTVSRLVERLVRTGLLDRAVDERNRRQSRLTLTTAGDDALRELRRASTTKFRQMQDRIPPEKLGHVLEAFDVLIAAMGEDSGTHGDSATGHIHEE
jgi:DNA-binding MarR family transcriptional regulator